MSLRLKLITAVVVATSLAIGCGVLLTRRFFDTKLRDVEEQIAEDDLRALRSVVEAQMVTGHDRGALQSLVKSIRTASSVTWVAILDAHGTIQVSSDGAPGVVRFPEDSPERRYLQEWQQTRDSHVHAHINSECDTLRTIMPAVNKEACWRCHGSDHAINGMLIVDRSLKPLHRTLSSVTTGIAVGGVAVLLVIIGTLGLVVERGVLTRLARLRVAARELGAGQLAARARDRGDDELGDVVREFNGMAARLESAMLQLAAQRGQLDAVINGVPDGIVLVDLDGRVIIANHPFTEMMQGDASAGSTYRDVLRSAGVDDGNQEIPAESALRDGRLQKGIMTLRGDRFVEVYAQPIVTGGSTAAVIEVWRDVTDRKQLEATVEQSDRLASLGMLASSVAHEVGNPLSSIVTAVDALLGTLPSPPSGAQEEECRTYLEVVRKQAFRCRRVTERLLGFARVPSEGPDSVVDVVAVAREVATLIGPQAAAQRVAMEIVGPSQVLALAPDGVVEQVFLNLMLNALKAMPSGGTVRVDIAAEDSTVGIAFADSGPGIPESVAKDLFKPFRSTRRNGGTGLGLFITHTLLARSGGSIQAHSGEAGATFVVCLRRALDTADAAFGRPEAMA